MNVRRVLVAAVMAGVSVGAAIAVFSNRTSETTAISATDIRAVPLLALDGVGMPTTCEGLTVDHSELGPAALANHDDGTTPQWRSPRMTRTRSRHYRPRATGSRSVT